MSGRWSILALLFAVRTTMALQFQSVAALAPLIQREFGVGLADVGLAIGLYLAPGIALAMPGGAIGQRFGDKPVVAAGLVLMICGGLVMAIAASWELQLAGRLVAGAGGILINVLMSKMVIDWFAGGEIATAMAIFVNSWPLGIALALITLPLIAGAHGVAAAFLAATGLVALGLLALVAFYPAPAEQPTPAGAPARPRGTALAALVLAGLAWGLYNASMGMVFGFGPSMLAERGWTLAAASSATSVVLWLSVVSVPLGGLTADRGGHRDAVLLGGCVAFATMLVIAASTDAVLPAFALLGLVSGIAAGPILSLPVRVRRPRPGRWAWASSMRCSTCWWCSAPGSPGMLQAWLGLPGSPSTSARSCWRCAAWPCWPSAGSSREPRNWNQFEPTALPSLARSSD